MARFTLNPLKGFSLKKAQGWIRKTLNIKGKKVRRRVPVDFTDAMKTATDQLRYTDPATGKVYNWNPYDIRDLFESKSKVGGSGPARAGFKPDPSIYDLWFGSANAKGIHGMTRDEMFDLLDERFKLYNQYHGWKVPIAYIYSRKSRVIKGTESLLAVRLRNGQKGWLTPSGKFIGQDALRELLHNVDQTSPAATSDISLLDAFDSLSAQGKADLADELQDFDWDVFWEEIGSDDPDRDLKGATDAYYALVERIGELLGW